MMVSISVLTHLLPLSAMARGLKLHQTGKLINHTQVNDPNKPVSLYFDECGTIAKNTRL
jgi:hypothetical protein